MRDFPEIYVLRHGQTEWNLAGRFQGRKDSALTELGQKQARQQGAILASLELGDMAAFCSPQKRAADTAKLAGLTAISDERLMEVAFGLCEGLTRVQMQARWPELGQSDDLAWHFQTPEGERFDQMRARCLDFLQSLSGPAVIVTHGITSRVLRGVWLGLELNAMSDLAVGQGCVYHLSQGQQTELT